MTRHEPEPGGIGPATGQDALPDPAPYPPAAPGRLRFRDLLVTVFLRWRLLLLSFLLPVLLGLAAGPLLPVRHQAETTLVVLTSRDWAGAPDLSGFGPTVMPVEMLKVVRSEVEILQSKEAVRRAIERVGLAALLPRLPDGQDGPAEGVQRAIESFQRALKVESDTSSNILRIRFTHADRQVAIAALTALVESYYARRAEVFADGNARVLTAELTRYTDRLAELDAAIQAVKSQFNVLDIGQEILLTAQRLDSLSQREERVREQRVTTNAQLASARSQLAAQPVRVFASQDATNLSPNDDSRNTLARLQLERQHIAAQYTPDYPALRDIDQRIALARTATRDAQRSSYSTLREVRNPAVELLSTRVVNLQVEASAVDRQLEELSQQRAHVEGRAAALRDADSQLRNLSRQREGAEAILRQFTTREAGARVEEEARRDRAPNVQTVEAPNAPLEGRSLKLIAALGGVAGGGGLLCATALLLTLTRRVFATTDEAERNLGLPALASFASLKAEARALKEVTGIADLAALLLDTRVDGRRPQVIQFLSGGEADGRGDLALSLAVEFARRRGADTLLIDLQTDGRGHLAALGSRPLEVERTRGHVLTFSTVIPNLWVSFEAQDSHLTDPQVGRVQTGALIAQLRDAFDVVLVIGPEDDQSYPMRRLTALVDLSVMVVAAEATRSDRAQRMRDWALASGGGLLGFVFTGRRRVLPRRLEAMI